MKPRTQAMEVSGGQHNGGRPKLPSAQKRNCPVKGGLEVCIDWKELKDGLTAEGIYLDFTHRTYGRIKGVVFTCDDISFGGYRIDCTMNI